MAHKIKAVENPQPEPIRSITQMGKINITEICNDEVFEYISQTLQHKGLILGYIDADDDIRIMIDHKTNGQKAAIMGLSEYIRQHMISGNPFYYGSDEEDD